VYRVNVGSNGAKLDGVMNKLQLELWKGKPASSDVVDVMVPPTAVKDFEASTKDMETAVMHDNLGLSIADEQTFSVYAGTPTPYPQNSTSYKEEIEHSGDYIDARFSDLLSKP
jgi:carboxypeptidase A4